MRVTDVRIHRRQFEDYQNQPPAESHFGTRITTDSVIRVDGDAVALYMRADFDLASLRTVVKAIDYYKVNVLGMPTWSTRFGYEPGRDSSAGPGAPGATPLTRNKPDDYAELVLAGEQLARRYEEFMPARYALHAAGSASIDDKWKIGETPFTNGIINRNNPLKYHYDQGNFDGALTALICFRDPGVSGGHLVIPELDCGFDAADNTIVLFDGGRYYHGVTPIVNPSGTAFRYTVLYYTLKQLRGTK